MLIVLEQVFYLAIFFLAGYLLSKLRVIKPEHSKLLSSLIIYVFLPCTIIRSFITNFTIANLTTYYRLILTSAVILGINIGLSFLLQHFGRDAYSKNVYKYSSVVPNGNIGYGFAEPMYGTEGLLRFSVFNLPVLFYCYTVGYALLTKQKMSFKKLLNPVTVSMLIGIILGLLPIKMPSLVTTLLGKGSACMIPVCMITIGIGISEFKLRELFNDWRPVVFALIRMFVLPLTLRLVLPLILPTDIVLIAVLFYSLPCGMNTVIFAKLVDEDMRTGAKLVFISHVLAIISIPLLTYGLV